MATHLGKMEGDVGNHMLMVREMAGESKKKMVGMLGEIPKDIERHWRGGRRCQRNDGG
jgi:hypothetical protein